MVLLNFPLLIVFDRDATVFGLPLLPVALFAIWAILIGLLAWAIERRAPNPLAGKAGRDWLLWTGDGQPDPGRRGRPVISPHLVIGVSFGYLLVLFVIAAYGDRRAARGRSVIGSGWIYALSLGVYCSAWTYFGSVGRAAASGVWFLPIYLGPMLAMLLAWIVVRKMIRIAQTYRITSIADFIASRYGKSPLLAALVTLITVDRHRSLHRAAAEGRVGRLSPAHHRSRAARGP